MLALGQRIRLWRVNSGKWFHVARPCDACRKRGHWVQGAPSGASDLMGILDDGRLVCIEVKSDKGRQSEEQVRWQKMIEGRGGVYVLARSVDDVLGLIQ